VLEKHNYLKYTCGDTLPDKSKIATAIGNMDNALRRAYSHIESTNTTYDKSRNNAEKVPFLSLGTLTGPEWSRQVSYLFNAEANRNFCRSGSGTYGPD
jgi:hypothetical protein